MIVQQHHPVLGPIQMPNVPFRFSDVDVLPLAAAPLLGQHNREVLTAVGYSDAELDELERDGVLYAEPTSVRRT